LVPYFFALSQSVHEGLGDLTFLYKQGKISTEEKQIYEALTISGPLDTITLRNQLNLSALGSPSRFNRALDLLQHDLRIIPSGISQNGMWKYAYIYQTVQNEFPDLIEQSIRINVEDAFIAILRSYFRSNGAGTSRNIQKLFGWQVYDIHKAINSLITSGEIIQAYLDKDKGEDIFAIQELI